MKDVIKPYSRSIFALLAVVLAVNITSLATPRLAGLVIDAVGQHAQVENYLWSLLAVALIVTLLLIAQNVTTARLSEKVAFDLRERVMKSLTKQPYTYVGTITPGELVTRLTSDAEAVKMMIAQGIPNIGMAIVMLLGSIVMLFAIHWKLALVSLTLLPVIVIVFANIFKKVGVFFAEAQKNAALANKVINQSILGAMLVRVLNSQAWEEEKFGKVNARSKEIGYGIVSIFSLLVPVITLISNAAILLILWFGGTWTMSGSMTVGEMSAFLSYYQLLIMPIFMLGFISSFISRGQISYGRMQEVIKAGEVVEKATTGTVQKALQGSIACQNVSLTYGAKTVLKDVSFSIGAGKRVALLGPTGAGKTQILTLLAGLLQPTSGKILLDNTEVSTYNEASLRAQIGVVFQESIIFQASLKENIQFKTDIPEAQVERAIRVAQLEDVITAMPQGMNTMLSERGANLSGGQKQRLMLARALAMNPKIVLLDDFTARVDVKTEQQIQEALQREFPAITLLNITQKIEPVKEYDQIIFLMEGEILGQGTHQELLASCPEYAQMYASQQTTEEPSV